MPAGAQPLTVQIQNGAPCLWAVVDPNAPLVLRQFRMLGTGHAFPEQQFEQYIGTFPLAGGQLVFHLFCEREPVEYRNRKIEQDNLRYGSVRVSDC
jgi:hypothetical protein